ncbi:MAG: methionine--tRNA ligase [Proteobacteria bacterium]|nr:methionine--tRNA ligase [Pseudomonadota bacterium]
MTQQRSYLTTPIYYVNDVPHLGHAYTTIVADTLARFHRMRGDETWFLTGTDEHGQKVEEAAIKQGLTAQQLCDRVAPRFADAWKTLGIENDDFIRTTEERHKHIVGKLWHRISQAGDLYLETYQGWYCVGCEAFYKESDLDKVAEAFHCKVHKARPVEWLDKERSWFFRLSKYAERLIEHVEKNPQFIRPEQYRSEILAFLRGGLKDLSVSRTSFAWGIPVPEADPEGRSHVIYVWLDALTNYYSALCDHGELGGPRVEKFWSEAVHLIGKDILRFHAVYWPAFLMSANLPLPKSIVAHGWWTIRGEKISKSMPATRIGPIELATALGEPSSYGFPIGVDAMRYYLLREVPLGNDGDFTFESLFGRYTSDLANDLGNLVNRSITLLGQGFAASHLPTRPAQLTTQNSELVTSAILAIKDATHHLEQLAPNRALEAIWRFVGEVNRYVNDTALWKQLKGDDHATTRQTMYMLLSSLHLISRLIAPVMPHTSKIVRDILGAGPATWPTEVDGDLMMQAFDLTPPTATTPLFPRLDAKQQDAIVERLVPAELRATALPPTTEPAPAAAKKAKKLKEPEPLPGPATIQDFKKLELRSGRVLAAQPVTGTTKLLHLTVDLGEAQPRSIVAGIAEKYPAAAMIGRQVIVVANLAPTEIRGVRSEGMILAAGDDAILGLSALDGDVPPGTRVR